MASPPAPFCSIAERWFAPFLGLQKVRFFGWKVSTESGFMLTGL